MTCAFAFALPPSAAANVCKPRRALAPIVLKDMGPCNFNPETLSFEGDAKQQAACLVRPVAKWAKLGPVLEELPPALAKRVGNSDNLPSRDALFSMLSELGYGWTFAVYLWQPVSRANDNDPAAPAARYLMIHDTAGPEFGRKPFPTDIDGSWYVNNFGRHRCVDDWESAHAFINRRGEMLLGHEFDVPWRATKFERAKGFDDKLKGLFLHVEMVQPRRRERYNRRRTISVGPVPGFTPAQYDRLALIYTIASVRAGRWLIPAFHAVVDNNIRNGHDDPQNFELAAFARSIEVLAEKLKEPAAPRASLK